MTWGGAAVAGEALEVIGFFFGLAENFDAEDDGGGVDAIEFLYFGECLGEFAEGGGVEEEDHVDKFGIGVLGIDG